MVSLVQLPSIFQSIMNYCNFLVCIIMYNLPRTVANDMANVYEKNYWDAN